MNYYRHYQECDRTTMGSIVGPTQPPIRYVLGVMQPQREVQPPLPSWRGAWTQWHICECRKAINMAKNSGAVVVSALLVEGRVTHCK
jgi:hypothetical protein